MIRDIDMMGDRTELAAGLPVEGGAALIPAFDPPMLSFVIVNWNYGDYIGETIQSIRAQDYPNFECIILDNGSDDRSADAIRDAIEGDERFRATYLPENLGQLGAAFVGFREARGSFVALIDSDDVLFPSFGSMHIQTHLAVPLTVGMTSSNVIQVNGAARPLTSSYDGLAVKHPAAVPGIRPAYAVARISTISEHVYNSVLARHVVSISSDTPGWLWSPGSANVLRRSVLDLFLEDGGRARMRAADSYLMPLCHAFAGSALIDVPLSTYRIHHRNFFSKAEAISGMQNGTREFFEEHRLDCLENMEIVLARAGHNTWLLGDRFWQVLDQLPEASGLRREGFYATPDVIEAFKRAAPQLLQSTGLNEFVNGVRRRFSLRDSFSILRSAFGGRIPVSAFAAWSLVTMYVTFVTTIKRAVSAARRVRSLWA